MALHALGRLVLLWPGSLLDPVLLLSRCPRGAGGGQECIVVAWASSPAVSLPRKDGLHYCYMRSCCSQTDYYNVLYIGLPLERA